MSHGIHCCPSYFLSFARPASVHCEEYVCMYSYPTWIEIVYELPLLPSNCEWNIFTKIRRTANFWVDIYHWGTGLVVTGRVRDIGHKVLQYYFQTGSSSSPSYCHIFFLIAFLEETFIRNKIILLYFNYTVIFYHDAIAPVGQGLLIVEDSWSHSDTPHSVGLLWPSDHHNADTSTWQHTTLTRDRFPWHRRDSNPQSQQASGSRSIP
jgi:hypothetical protein